MAEGTETKEKVEVTDDQAANDVINEAEPKVEESQEFKGLLRDAQADRAALSHANAENAAYKQEIERLQNAAADAKKATDSTLTEEEAAEEVNRGQLHATLAAHNKGIVAEITKLLDARETRTTQANLKKNQAADAQALKRTHTVETRGLSLDAKTVVEETIAFLSVNNPELLEALSRQPDYASLVYKIGSGEALVPMVGKRVKLRNNTLLAQQLDDKNKDVPGGGAPSGDDLGVFEAIMSSGEEMTDDNLDKLYET